MNERTENPWGALIASLGLLLLLTAATGITVALTGWLIDLPHLIAPPPADAAVVDPTAAFPTSTPADPPLEAPVTSVAEPATPTPLPPTVAPPMPTYTVRPGDTLATIARAYAITVEELVAVNAIGDPNLVYAGQVLRIPVDPSVTPIWPTATATLTPTPSPPLPTPTAAPIAGVGRWIDVDLSEQTVTAYQDGTPVRTTLASTGLPHTPTPVGQFHIWIKLRTDDMSGPDYYIEDVPFVMYFHGGYGIHGVTWHANFGQPMSHGCVNLPTEEAAWLFDWAAVGTLVNVHE
jgi:lipoprotein-anchoring transpeptidase ErfK/SrfK